MPLYIRMVDLHHPPYKQAIRKDLGKDSGTFHCCSIYRNASSTHAVCKCLCHHRFRFGTECFFFTWPQAHRPGQRILYVPVPDTLPLPGFPVSSILLPVPVKNAVHMLWKPHIHRTRLCTERSAEARMINPAAFRQIWQADSLSFW